MVALARERDVAVRFVLIGYMDREHGPWQSEDARFTIHGHYRARDLPELLDHYRTELVMFPSAGPETFSFTLSEAWAAGRPVLVPPIGALAERVEGTQAGWIWTDDEWRSESAMLDAVLARLADRDALHRAGEQGGAVHQATPAGMARETVAMYESAIRASRVQRAAPLAPVRLRDALGYRMWYPPIPEGDQTSTVPATPPPSSEQLPVPERVPPRLTWRIAHRIAGTPLGRVLRDIAPMPVRNALRAKLKP